MRYRRTIAVLTAFLIGIWLGSANTALIPTWLPWLPLASLPFWRTKRALITTLILILAFSYARGFRRAQFRSFTPGKTSFTGKVVAAPDIRWASQYLKVLTDEPIATSITGEPATGIVLVKTDPYLTITYGDRIEAKGNLEAPEPFEGFNYPLFLERDHIFAILPLAKVSILEKGNSHTLASVLSSFRTRFESSINRYIPEPESSFLSGLLFGSRRAIPSDVSTAMQATGTSHLVAISGANITFITAGALLLLPIANRFGQTMVIAFVAGFLCLLAGNPASVVRGAVIAGTTSIVRAFGRRPWPLATILLAASLMLISNPLLLRADPGFQLSFAAYAGLLAFSGLVGKMLEKARIPPVVHGSATETSSATLGTFPLTVANGTFAARGLIINPLVLWLIPPATALGFLLLFSSIFPPLATLIAIPTWAILHLALRIITVGGAL